MITRINQSRHFPKPTATTKSHVLATAPNPSQKNPFFSGTVTQTLNYGALGGTSDIVSKVMSTSVMGKNVNANIVTLRILAIVVTKSHDP